MPPDEFEFGKKMGSKYWLYLVWNVFEGNPILVAFRDPFNRGDLFDITRKEQEVVMRKTVYQIKFRKVANENSGL